MTRKNQVCRSWISRSRPAHTYKSHVSFAGTVRTLSTGTRIRRAAREFNRLHLIAILTGKPAPTPTPAETPELFQ